MSPERDSENVSGSVYSWEGIHSPSLGCPFFSCSSEGGHTGPNVGAHESVEWSRYGRASLQVHSIFTVYLSFPLTRSLRLVVFYYVCNRRQTPCPLCLLASFGLVPNVWRETLNERWQCTLCHNCPPLWCPTIHSPFRSILKVSTLWVDQFC